MSKSLEALREALYGTGLVQPIDVKGRGGSVSFLCRQLPGQEAPWIAVVDQLLLLAEEKSLDLHICRRYVRRNGGMVFGWFLGIETKNAASLVEAAGAIVEVLKTAKPDLSPAAPAPRGATNSRQGTLVMKPLTRQEIESHTKAFPRPPNEAGPDPVAPSNVIPALKVVARGQDEKGRPTDIVEMPLPHTYKDLNVPKPVSGGPLKWAKGAQATIGGG